MSYVICWEWNVCSAHSKKPQVIFISFEKNQNNCNKRFHPKSDESYSLDENIENRCNKKKKISSNDRSSMHVHMLGNWVKVFALETILRNEKPHECFFLSLSILLGRWINPWHKVKWKISSTKKKRKRFFFFISMFNAYFEFRNLMSKNLCCIKSKWIQI